MLSVASGLANSYTLHVLREALLLFRYVGLYPMAPVIGAVAFALAVGSFMLVVFNRGPIGPTAELAVLGSLVPPPVAFKGFPTRNAVKVTPEELGFSHRSPVPFAQLSS